MTIDRERGLLYVSQGNYLKGFSVYDTNTNNWSVLTDLPVLPHNGSSLEYDPVTQAVYFTAGNALHHLYAYDVQAEEWVQKSSSPDRFGYGGGTTLIGDSLYAFRGEGTTGFYKYSIPKDSWLIPTRGLFGREFENTSLFTISAGSNIVKGDGDHFYLTRGNYADDFVRWNQVSGEFQRLANTPAGLHYGATLVYDSTQNKVYLTGGTFNQKFYVYDISTNVWSEEVADPTPLVTGYGSSMVYDGSRYIYLTRGINTTTFYQFDTQGSAGTKWSTLATAPAALGYGSKMVLRDGVIYTLRGQNVANNPFYRYTIATNTWDTALAPMIAPVHSDGFLLDGNDGHLYLARATNSNQFFRYSFAQDAWEQLGAIPGQISVGGSGASNATNKLYALAGNGTLTYQDALYTYVLPTEDSGFVESGTYTTQAHDFASVYKWANVSIDQAIPANTSLTITTRSSQDAAAWSDWSEVTQAKEIASRTSYKINSPAARYLQLRFELASSDGVASSSVAGYSVSYYQDTLAPSNPQDSGLSALSASESGSVLVSNVWYNHPAPQFSWPPAEETYGATDTTTGSGVTGYYVYFGTTAGADPEELGALQVGTTFAVSSLNNGQTYYLRIKTRDAAGNVSSDTWQPFIYKYDGSTPAAPASVTADPSGFTSTDSFTFSWSEVAPAGAVIVAYCYKTGASEGPYSVDQCGVDRTVSEVPSYRVGTNTFSVRARDEAGNYSPYATTSYFYADSASAPAPPRNLSVSPETSTSNSFGFTWDAPAAGTFLGSESNLSYLYSINAVPTPQSTSATSLKSLLPGAFATLPGENILYIVSKDEAGNINYSNYAQVSFFANTVAPGIPINMEIADVSVKSTSSWRLAISWDEPLSAGSGVANYQIYRSLDGVTFSLHSTTAGASFVDTKLEQINYYYQVVACDSTTNCGAPSTVVTLLPTGKFTEAPLLTAAPVVSGISTRKASVNWSTDRTSDSRIAFGTSPGTYFDEEVANSEQVINHTLSINNLTPGTTYYYVVRWTDEDGNRGESSEASFTTEAPPSTEEPTARNVGLTTALIQFTSRNAEKVKIYFGETAAFGGLKEIVTGKSEGTHTVELTDLKDGAKYFYKINTVDSDGAEYEGEVHSFETLPRPEVSDISIVQVEGTAQTTLLIRWIANTEISSIVTYFPTSQPEKALDQVNIALKSGNHRMILYNLEPQRPYTIIIRGQDIVGNEAVSAPQQITTASDTRPPQVVDLNVESEILGEGEEAVAQLVVTFKTDEPATSQIEYAEGTGTTYGQKTQEDATLKSSHLVIISGLQPSKVYHLRAITKDEAGNEGASLDKVVVTPKATENALDLVMTNLDFIFGFLQNR
jgi:hypothetical protein